MNYLKLVALVVGLFFVNSAFSEDCGSGNFLKVYVQQESGEFKKSNVNCTKLETNAIVLVETNFVGLKYNSPFYFDIKIQKSLDSSFEVFRCGSSTQPHTLKDLAVKVLSKLKVKKTEFEIEPESDFGVIQKISQGISVSEYTPNNYPTRIILYYALGPLFPFEEDMELAPDCTKLE